MKAAQHWRLFCIATTWWTLFFIIGLPWNYFLDSPLWFIVIFGIVMPAAAMTWYGYRRALYAPERAYASVLWLAFYVTVPLFIYDYVFLAMHQQRGWSFLRSHWYLTTFYILPWLLLPVTAWYVRSMQSRRALDKRI